ncbi:MAG: GDSL-type esterase/lipase family protein [Chloroflexota bacterium]
MLSRMLIGLITLLLLSIGANVVLVDHTLKRYREVNEVRLTPLGLHRYGSSHSAKTDPSQRRVLFFGDSRAEAWPFPIAAEFEFVNRGIGSQTTAQIRGRFAEHVVPVEPDIMVLQLGVNDLKTISLFPEKRNEIVANCKANIQWIVEESKALGAEVILTTVFSRGPIPFRRQWVWTNDVDEAILELNEYIFTLASDSVTILDAKSLLSGDNFLTDSQYRLDMLHINEDGYELLNEALLAQLAE